MSESPENGEEKKPDGNDVVFAEAEVKTEASDAPLAAEAAPEPAKPAEPDPLDVAKAEAAKYREQLLRTAADFDNFRKRSRREVDDATRKGKEQALKELLPVFDNLERAATSAEAAPDVKSVADGLKMVGRQFTNTLEKLGIKRIQAVGKPFDPSLHEAIQHVESKEHEAGVITTEVQAGYMLGDYLLRAAMVVVSKGAPEAEAAADAGTDDKPTDPS